MLVKESNAYVIANLVQSLHELSELKFIYYFFFLFIFLLILKIY